MSWGVNLIGKPSKIAEALKQESENLTDQSKVEFDAALPHLEALVKENFDTKHAEPIVHLIASGHGYVQNGEHKDRCLTVNLQVFYGKLLV